MEKPVILCYAVPEGIAAELKKLAHRFGAGIRRIPREAYSLPIAAAAGGLAPRSVYTGEELPEPMAVFVNFPDGALDVFLSELCRSEVRIPLKAVLTPYNAVWTADRLYEELCREREAFARRKP